MDTLGCNEPPLLGSYIIRGRYFTRIDSSKVALAEIPRRRVTYNSGGHLARSVRTTDMALPIDPDQIAESHLQSLRDTGVSEGILYDYKGELYGATDSEKKEFLKDVSSFANTAGGHIVIGMTEDGGVPIDLIGVQGNLDQEKQRLENLLRDRMEPRIVGVRIQPVELENGRYALVIKVPKSWNLPHAVLHNQSRLIYARNSAGAHMASVDEM